MWPLPCLAASFYAQSEYFLIASPSWHVVLGTPFLYNHVSFLFFSFQIHSFCFLLKYTPTRVICCCVLTCLCCCCLPLATPPASFLGFSMAPTRRPRGSRLSGRGSAVGGRSQSFSQGRQTLPASRMSPSLDSPGEGSSRQAARLRVRLPQFSEEENQVLVAKYLEKYFEIQCLGTSHAGDVMAASLLVRLTSNRREALRCLTPLPGLKGAVSHALGFLQFPSALQLGMSALHQGRNSAICCIEVPTALYLCTVF